MNEGILVEVSLFAPLETLVGALVLSRINVTRLGAFVCFRIWGCKHAGDEDGEDDGERELHDGGKTEQERCACSGRSRLI